MGSLRLFIGATAVWAAAGCATEPDTAVNPSFVPTPISDTWVSCDDDVDYTVMGTEITPATVVIERTASSPTSSSALRDPSERQGIIINGTPVDSDERFPWAAQLYVYFEDSVGQYRSHCGGTILNENWILTAAHCVDVREQELSGETVDFLHVAVGVGGLEKDELTQYTASNALCHKDYNSPGRLNNDIALVKLDTPLDMSQANIGAATLPSQGSDALSNQTGTVIVKPIGWGKTEAGALSENLLQVDVAVDPAKTGPYSFESYPSTGVVMQVCQGDSGGSANDGVNLNYGSGTVMGVMSYTTASCNSQTNRSGFARVSTYRDDIDNALSYCNQTECFE